MSVLEKQYKRKEVSKLKMNQIQKKTKVKNMDILPGMALWLRFYEFYFGTKKIPIENHTETMMDWDDDMYYLYEWVTTENKGAFILLSKC